MKLSRPLILALAVLATTSHAAAASSPSDAEPSDQETLRAFEEGRRFLAARKYAEALQVFQRLHAEHPSVGALFNIADAQERMAHPLAAWATYQEAEQLAFAKLDNRRQQAVAKAAALEAYLPRLIVTDPPADLEVTIKDPVPRSEWNGPLRRGPGTYDLVARAHCRKTLATRIVIPDEARSADVVVPALATDPTCLPADTGRPQRLVGYGISGAGLALLGVGVTLGIVAMSTKSELTAACGGHYEACQTSDRSATDALNVSARSEATWSTVAIIAGAAVLVGGVSVLLTSPKPAARGSARAPIHPMGAGWAW